jgi:rare lipoprotein A (peptidoglycan hydrolase)
MQTALASFYSYGPGASVACGHPAYMGVANRTLRCGTRVRFCVTRCAIGIVDDRGPFVYGRLFDLTVQLAKAIGFPLGAGVWRVRWRIGR